MKDTVLTSFDEIIEITLEHEGGYVHDPKDLGGETNFGIAGRFYPDVDIKNLTKEGAKDIYKKDYWDKNKVDDLPDIVKGEYNATGSDGTPIFQSYNNTQLTTYLVKSVQELTQAHNNLIAAITGSSDLNELKSSVTGSLIGI